MLFLNDFCTITIVRVNGFFAELSAAINGCYALYDRLKWSDRNILHTITIVIT